jgi:Trypsin
MLTIVSLRLRQSGRVVAGRLCRFREAGSWAYASVALVAVLVCASAGVAYAVVGGERVPITVAPWTVVVRQTGYEVCTGVILSSSRILTAGHCVMSGDSAKELPASEFTVEAGVSDFKHPLPSDHPQLRAVGALRSMPGYIAVSKTTNADTLDAVGHDLAVLTLVRPLDLRGNDARAAYLPGRSTPAPSHNSHLVLAGFGNENPNVRVYPTGDLNEVVKPKVATDCSTDEVLCMYMTTATCWGDSGSGAVEPGQRPIAMGILSESLSDCSPGWDYYVSLTSPTARRFISASFEDSDKPVEQRRQRIRQQRSSCVGDSEC